LPDANKLLALIWIPISAQTQLELGAAYDGASCAKDPQNKYELTLPVSKKKLVVRLLTHKDEKDINQFEIYKGEILNGNDSADLVKKFKIWIMKMVKKDLLPKSQAKELLMDLVSLGY
jgi:hypothetical protein